MGSFASPSPGPRAEEWVGECLERLDGRVTRVGPGQWRLARPGEDKARATVAVDRGWLVVERPVPGCRITRLPRTTRWSWRLLDPGVSLASGARAVLPPGETDARIRAERPMVSPRHDDPEVLARWIGTACAGAASYAGGARTTAMNIDADESCGTNRVDIPELCELAGWSATVRSASGEAVVALPARDGDVCHATATTGDGALNLHVALGVAGDAETTPLCQAAVALALLRAAGSVRLVRSTATRHDGHIAAALEVRLQPPVGIETLNHALSALAFAHQQIASELEALAGDDSLAGAYLALQGAR